jgi:Uma2 family endonuclease
MTSLLESPAIRQRVHPMSVETYHRLGEMGALSEDVELLRGFVVTKMPKSPLHEYVAQVLMELLLGMLPRGFTLRPERPLALGGSEPEPDLAVVKGSSADWLRAHPTTAALVIEVAVSSAEIDESKAAIYAEGGIPEYWIVQPELRTVIVYREPSTDGYRLRTRHTEPETLSCGTLPGVTIAIAAMLPPKP